VLDPSFLQSVNVSILPNADATYDLGSSSYRWRYGYFANGIISNGIFKRYGTIPYDVMFVDSTNYEWYLRVTGSEAIEFDTYDKGAASRIWAIFSLWPDGSKIYWKGNVGNHILPSADNTYDLGSSSYRWANIYCVNLYASSLVQVGDLAFKNKWRFTEDDKHGLILISPEGKKYRLKLEEIAA